jgi:hypothetical protein
MQFTPALDAIGDIHRSDHACFLGIVGDIYSFQIGNKAAIS